MLVRRYYIGNRDAGGTVCGYLMHGDARRQAARADREFEQRNVIAERAVVDSPGGYRGAGGGRCIYRHGLGFRFGGARGVDFRFF